MIKKTLCEILFGQSSLNQLKLSPLDGISEDCFSLLQTNTCLTSVNLEGRGVQVAVFQTFSNILLSNKALQKIHLDINKPQLLDLEQVERFNASLATNTTLKEFSLDIWFIEHEKDRAQVHKLSSLISDARVTINQ